MQISILNTYFSLETFHKWRRPLRGMGICQKVMLVLISKMGDKGEGGVKNLKKMGDII